MRTTTSGPGDIPVASEWVPAREPFVESVRPQPPLQPVVNPVVNPKPESASVSNSTLETTIPTLAYASQRIPTLFRLGETYV